VVSNLECTVPHEPVVGRRVQAQRCGVSRDRRYLWQTTACQACTDPEVNVSTTLEILEAEVLKLAPADRSHLLERLIVSLDPDPEVEEAWEREADRREAELESGSVVAVPGHEAIARLRARLAR
jgi:putative addiction module component (TIGR02574 family)